MISRRMRMRRMQRPGGTTTGRAPAVLLALLAAAPAAAGAQGDDNELDRFMEQVLEQRERNTAVRLQYVLDEQSRFRLTGPGGAALWAFRGEYTWYERDGFFVRSPVRIDGMTIDEERRREYEADWLQRERRRALEAAAGDAGGSDNREPPASDPAWGGLEPRFVSDAYFLDFEFEPGNYYLVGRETLDGHDVLRIEYYPEQMLTEDRDAADGEVDRDGDPDRGRGRGEAAAADNRRPLLPAARKTSLITLWVDPAQHQIVRYTFDNLGFDFLPGRWLFRLDDLIASMTMRQPFSGVWLPARIDMRAELSLATGGYEAAAARIYDNYREAETGGRVLAVGPGRSGPDLPR